jgi:hypothetical protein
MSTSETPKTKILHEGDSWKAIPLPNFDEFYSKLKASLKSDELSKLFDKDLIDLMDVVIERKKELDTQNNSQAAPSLMSRIINFASSTNKLNKSLEYDFHLELTDNQIASLRKYNFINATKPDDSTDLKQLGAMYEALTYMYFDYDGTDLSKNFPNPTFINFKPDRHQFKINNGKIWASHPFHIVLQGPIFMGYNVYADRWGRDSNMSKIFNATDINAIQEDNNSISDTRQNYIKNSFYNNPVLSLYNKKQFSKNEDIWGFIGGEPTTGMFSDNVYDKASYEAVDLLKFLQEKGLSLERIQDVNFTTSSDNTLTSKTFDKEKILSGISKVYLGTNGWWNDLILGDNLTPYQKCTPRDQIGIFPAIQYPPSESLNSQVTLLNNQYIKDTTKDTYKNPYLEILKNSDKKDASLIKKYTYLFLGEKNSYDTRSAVGNVFNGTCYTASGANGTSETQYISNPLLYREPTSTSTSTPTSTQYNPIAIASNNVDNSIFKKFSSATQQMSITGFASNIKTGVSAMFNAVFGNVKHDTPIIYSFTYFNPPANGYTLINIRKMDDLSHNGTHPTVNSFIGLQSDCFGHGQIFGGQTINGSTIKHVFSKKDNNKKIQITDNTKTLASSFDYIIEFSDDKFNVGGLTLKDQTLYSVTGTGEHKLNIGIPVNGDGGSLASSTEPGTHDGTIGSTKSHDTNHHEFDVNVWIDLCTEKSGTAGSYHINADYKKFWNQLSNNRTPDFNKLNPIQKVILVSMMTCKGSTNMKWEDIDTKITNITYKNKIVGVYQEGEGQGYIPVFKSSNDAVGVWVSECNHTSNLAFLVGGSNQWKSVTKKTPEETWHFDGYDMYVYEWTMFKNKGDTNPAPATGGNAPAATGGNAPPATSGWFGTKKGGKKKTSKLNKKGKSKKNRKKYKTQKNN